jgi:hypothetical protein
MKKIILVCLLCNFSFISYSQDWQWAKHYGGADGYNGAGNLTKDSFGNIYFAGAFSSPYGIFDNDTLHIGTATTHLFILKCNENGNLIWIKHAGGNFINDNSVAGDIRYDSISNSIYSTGFISNSSAIGTCFLGVSNNIYLARLDTNGNCIWGETLGGTQFNSDGGSITLDDVGNIYILGLLQNDGTIGSYSVSAGGFLAKFNSNGICLWAKKLCGPGNYTGRINFTHGCLIISGSSLTDTIVVDTAHILNHGLYDGFLARLDTSGNIAWLKAIGGTQRDGINAFDSDKLGNLFLAGVFQDTVYFDTTALINTSPSYSMFFSKWDLNGNVHWAKKISTLSTSTAFTTETINVYTDILDNTYLVGRFNDGVDFGDGHAVNTTDSSNMFVTRYDSSGNCLGALNFGFAEGISVCADENGVFYVAGTFKDNVQLGSTTLNSYYTGISPSLGDIYLAKHDAITGIRDPERPGNNQLLIYANPNEGKCIVTTPDDFFSEKKLVLNVYDNIGKLIQQKTIVQGEGKIKLSLEKEAKGIYYVLLSNSKKNYSGKIVKE